MQHLRHEVGVHGKRVGPRFDFVVVKRWQVKYITLPHSSRVNVYEVSGRTQNHFALLPLVV